MVWGALGALIFSVYLVYDTQVKSVNVIYWWVLGVLDDYEISSSFELCRSFIILGEPSIVSIIFPDDDWRGPQVLDLPRGVHLRSPRHLP